MSRKHNLGWDIGDGDNTVNGDTQDQIDVLKTGAGRPFELDDSKAVKSMTILTYDNEGSPHIGSKAKIVARATGKPIYRSIKRAPDAWDARVPWTDKKYRDLMFDFIAEQWRQIKKHMHLIDTDEVRLIVGCPSTRRWLDQKEEYAALIRAATGVEDVEVMAESRAAMFNFIAGQEYSETFKAEDGLLILDFGSSTADCTYVCLGQELLEFGFDLGAHSIEDAMYAAILPDTIPDDCWIPAEEGIWRIDLREKKESYFLGEDSFIYYMQYRAFDFDAKAFSTDGIDKKNRPKYRQKPLTVQAINSEFIESAISNYRFSCNRLNDRGETEAVAANWYEHLNAFLEKADRMLKEKNLACQTIILTGGASYMDFIQTHCRNMFPSLSIYQIEDPSRSVSSGLLMASIIDQQLPKVREDAVKNVRELIAPAFETFIDGCADDIGQIIFNEVKESARFLSDDDGQWTGRQAKEMQEERVRKKLSPDVLSEVFKKNESVFLSSAQKAVADTVNEQIKPLFPDRISPRYIAQMPNLGTDFTLQNLSQFTAQISGGAFGFLIGLLDAVTAILALAGFLIAAIFGEKPTDVVDKTYTAIEDGLEKWRLGKPVSKKARQKAYKKFGEIDKKRIVEKTRANLVKTLQDQMGNTYEKVFVQIDEAIDRAFDIIALKDSGFHHVTMQ